MSTVIKVENLGKQYRLGSVGTGSFAHDLNRTWHRLRGKADPYLKIGEENDRTVKGGSDYVWALRDVSFEVQHGEVLGIIGRNGAGKSTLLKILSRTTAPSTGSVKIRGRVASLLEVGTGFHPELSGRDNIFLNGAILGMTKQEIKSKFDEIVDFAGVERYIDTPVKRYSSGMYVRLAFAVAAHLEPEILIVDEVLAVGDAEFQKKALGKMKDVSNKEGRTVLFVSHNMSAIQNLCTSALLFSNGRLIEKGAANAVIISYLSSADTGPQRFTRRLGNRKAVLTDYFLTDVEGTGRSEFLMGDDLFLNLTIQFSEAVKSGEIGLNIKNQMGEIVTHVTNLDQGLTIDANAGDTKQFLITLKNITFSPQLYSIDIALVKGVEQYDMIEDALSFTLLEGGMIKRGRFPSHVKVFVNSHWTNLDQSIEKN